VWPNTFIAGAQKSGTTTLCHALNSHPQVIVSSPKEPAFFSSAANLRTPNMYETCFRLKEEAQPIAIIDGSNAYMVNSSAAPRIRTMLGVDLHFIFCLRNPIERTVSGYWHQAKKGNDRRSMSAALAFDSSFLDDAVKEEEERVQSAAARGLIDVSYYADRHDDAFWNFRYFRNSLYSADLMRFYEIFGSDRVKTLLFEELVVNPLGAVLEVAEFLGLNPEFFPAHVNLHRNATKFTRAPKLVGILRRMPGRELLHRLPQYEGVKNAIFHRPPPTLDVEVEERLRHLFAAEVKRVEQLLKRDLAELWST